MARIVQSRSRDDFNLQETQVSPTLAVYPLRDATTDDIAYFPVRLYGWGVVVMFHDENYNDVAFTTIDEAIQYLVRGY